MMVKGTAHCGGCTKNSLLPPGASIALSRQIAQCFPPRVAAGNQGQCLNKNCVSYEVYKVHRVYILRSTLCMALEMKCQVK